MKEMDKKEKKRLAEAYTAVKNLELAGVDIESVNEEGDSFFDKKVVVRFTIPEKILINIERLKEVVGVDIGFSEINRDELISGVKKAMYKSAMDDDEFTEDEVKEYFKFFCKVRKGEVWDEAKLIAKLDELKQQLEKAREAVEGYNEV